MKFLPTEEAHVYALDPFRVTPNDTKDAALQILQVSFAAFMDGLEFPMDKVIRVNIAIETPLFNEKKI
jgi:hypothetical protein